MIYTFLDTGVLDELLEIPGHFSEDRSKQIKSEFKGRVKNGEKFVVSACHQCLPMCWCFFFCLKTRRASGSVGFQGL